MQCESVIPFLFDQQMHQQKFFFHQSILHKLIPDISHIFPAEFF